MRGDDVGVEFKSSAIRGDRVVETALPEVRDAESGVRLGVVWIVALGVDATVYRPFVRPPYERYGGPVILGEWHLFATVCQESDFRRGCSAL